MTLIPTIEETMETLEDWSQSGHTKALGKVLELYADKSEAAAQLVCEDLERHAADYIGLTLAHFRSEGEDEPDVEAVRRVIGIIWLANHRRAQGLPVLPFGEEEAAPGDGE